MLLVFFQSIKTDIPDNKFGLIIIKPRQEPLEESDSHVHFLGNEISILRTGSFSGLSFNVQLRWDDKD